MADQTEDLRNLDLNLGPEFGSSPVVGLVTEPSSGESVNVDELESFSLRDAFRQRFYRNRGRWRGGQFAMLPLGPHSLRLMLNSEGDDSDLGAGSGVDGEDNGGTLQAGEGSVAPELRSPKTCESNVIACESNVTAVDNGSLANKEDVVEKTNTEEGSFFDCNVCFDLARDPVVTCCGHLFCWSCIYRWLHIHSDAEECPVCKGEVTLKNVIPIYGRGNHVVNEPEEDAGIKIPVRPSALRVESLRQKILRESSSLSMEEMLRGLGARFDLNQDSPEILTRRRPPLVNRSGQSHRSELIRDLLSHHSPPGRSQDVQPPSVDDRDSLSSIGAVIHGESQTTMDTAVEIDSTVSLSTSSSRRRNEPSRTSDVDSGDSRAPRRRRLN